VQPLAQAHPAERGKPGRSPSGTATLAGWTGKHVARRAGLRGARRSTLEIIDRLT
jgi:hypothetical protein